MKSYISILYFFTPVCSAQTFVHVYSSYFDPTAHKIRRLAVQFYLIHHPIINLHYYVYTHSPHHNALITLGFSCYNINHYNDYTSNESFE